jgi:hypothetical protein
MKSAANRDFLGYALVFFNMKQYYLWFVQAIQLNDTYPDPVLQLIAYMEVLHCFKSALQMYRVFDALYACAPDRNSKGVVIRRRVTFAILLLSSGGGLMAYVAAEVHVAAVSFVIPLALIAGLEVLVDLYLLVCVNAELQGTAEPLKEALLADVTAERGEQADEGDEGTGEDGENAGDGGSHNEAETFYSCTTVLKRWRKTFGGLVFVSVILLVVGTVMYSSRKNAEFYCCLKWYTWLVGLWMLILGLPSVVVLSCCGFCGLRFQFFRQLGCAKRMEWIQRTVIVGLLTLVGVGMFIALAIAGGPAQDNLSIIVYLVAGYVCFCRISMFSLKIDCFHQHSKGVLQLFKVQWYFAAAGWLVAAALITTIALWPTNIDNSERDAGTSLKFMPSAALLWLFTVQSFAWCFTLRRKRTMTPLLCDKLSADMNSTQISMFNAKQLYLWALLAIQKGTSGDTSPQVICAHLMAYTEVLHSFKSLVFVSRVFDSIRGGGRSSAALLVMALCFAVGLALFLAALHFESVRDEEYAFILFSTCAFFFAVPEFCADLYALRWWTNAAEDGGVFVHSDVLLLAFPAPSGNRSIWSSDTQEELSSIDGGVRQGQTRARMLFSTEESKIVLLAGGIGRDADHGSRRGQSWVRKMLSTEEREDGQDTGQANSMATVPRALSVAVCLLSVVLTLLSSRALSLSAYDCRRGSDTFATRQALVSFTSALHSSGIRRCPDVWPQLCKSSCDWGHDLLQCDSNSRPINLTLGNQQLIGSIPVALGEFTSLQVVNISHNQLTSTIPSQLSSLSGLATLDLSSNQLTSTIPSQLSSLSGLTTLDLSHNALQGPIPSSLASLTALKVLRLNNNVIVGGTIPAGVPSVGFPQDGDCEMGGQCSACSYEACCDDAFNYRYQQYDPTCTGRYDGSKRRDTPMCRACGFYDTGTCSRHSSSCADAARSERMCGANCESTTHTNTPGGH